MGRKPKAVVESAAGSTEEAAAPAPVRRRRRSTTIDHAAQTQMLVEALLQARGRAGATLEDALRVILWARDVYAEAAEIAQLQTRVRLARSENLVERQTAYEVNKALLDGVLAGVLTVNVDEAGSLLFGHAELAA